MLSDEALRRAMLSFHDGDMDWDAADEHRIRRAILAAASLPQPPAGSTGTIPVCCVTGRIAGDVNACGDCDPCLLGASNVPDAVKRLLKERDEWANKFEHAALASQTGEETLTPDEAWQNLCDVDDRNSPAEYPDMCLITREELARFMRSSSAPPTVSEPTEPGAFKGDIWFGHPVKRNMGTHRWNGESWEVLQDETDDLLVLLAKAREEIALLKAAASTPAQLGLVELLKYIRDVIGNDTASALEQAQDIVEDVDVWAGKRAPEAGEYLGIRAVAVSLADRLIALRDKIDSAPSHAPSQPAPVVAESVNSKLLREATLLLQNVEDGFPMNTVEFPPWLRDCRKRIEAIAASPQPDRESELTTAIRRGCTAADVHLDCSYPTCKCKQIPAAITAALTSSNRPQATKEGK